MSEYTTFYPHSNHPSRKVSIIECLNYDKYQYLENSQPPQHQLSPDTNTLILKNILVLRQARM